MKAKISNHDPTGVEVEAEEFELPLVVEHTLENGYEQVTLPDGTVNTYEPARVCRYFLHIGGYIYRLNARTGELTLIKKGED